jgi:hydroxyacylglutathione hydrolase
MSERNPTVKRLFCSSNNTNAYLLVSEREAALIDAPDCCQDIQDALKELGANLRYILVTHGHRSHVSSLAIVKKNIGGTICLHKSDLELLQQMESNLDGDLLLQDNQALKLGDTPIKVLHTPGHTMGSLCYHVREAGVLFTGDTLFKGEFGKIRGPHSMGLMLRSLKRLNSVIPPKTTVYPGHGPSTTMSKEAWLDTLDNLS